MTAYEDKVQAQTIDLAFSLVGNLRIPLSIWTPQSGVNEGLFLALLHNEFSLKVISINRNKGYVEVSLPLNVVWETRLHTITIRREGREILSCWYGSRELAHEPDYHQTHLSNNTISRYERFVDELGWRKWPTALRYYFAIQL